MRVASWRIVLLVLTSACTAIVPPVPPPPGSPSAELLAARPYLIGRRNRTFVDGSRPADVRRAGPSPARRLASTIWYPVDATGPRPLVVYSHGFLANRAGGTYLARHLASRGYVVVAPDHPFTRRWARGGTRLGDVVDQPADLRVVIDRMLADDGGAPAFPGTIDPDRIGIVGLSLGGLTTTLTAFHPRVRDPRVKAAVSIAGPMTMFEPAFFARPSVPFLMIAGSADVIIDYASNAPLAVQRVPGGRLVAIGAGSHAGFDHTTGGALRVIDNPDRPACWWLTRVLARDRGAGDAVAALARPEDGMRLAGDLPRPCASPAPRRALDPARQQAITKLAVGAFFDSVMAADPAARRAAAVYLERDLARDFPEVRYSSARPAPEVATGASSSCGTRGCRPPARAGRSRIKRP